MPGELYTRWVPPSKPMASITSTPSKAKQERSSPNATLITKTPDDELEEETSSSSSEASDEDDQDERSTTPEPAPRAKKRKRGSDVQVAADEVDPSLKKHRSILSKFEKSMKLSAQESANNKNKDAEEEEAPAEELHDLVPLLQPAPVPDAPFKPTFSTLPTWLAKPITVSSTKAAPFASLGVDEVMLVKLKKQGYENALAVQSALVPMLQPGFEQHLGDICVSARTGSGKTLAYLLPIVAALKDRAVTTLSAIVIVPSRQLVDQVVKVAEELCVGTRLKVAAAQGSVPLTTEQNMLVRIRQQYDPRRSKERQGKANPKSNLGFTQRGSIRDHLAVMAPDHVPKYESSVDILVCTPGRLVEHIEATDGFSLHSVRWLVIDEADQLLNQNFQGWSNVVMDALERDTSSYSTDDSASRHLRPESIISLALPKRRQITKVILSATMKKDLTKLGTLRLRRPKLVVVENDLDEQRLSAADGDVFELPTTLDEFGLPVSDGSKKPLYLLYLLLYHIFSEDGSNNESKDTSESDSNAESGSNQPGLGATLARHSSRVLIFTKSNENASRLLHLLSFLEPPLVPYMKAMAPSATSKASQKILRYFAQGKTKILVASDAASRGLDIPDITHVVNYDIPSSITSYVHRVGRTARAGKAGQAWTLVAKNEAAWFWKTIATGGVVNRGERKVTRQELSERDVTWDRKRMYQEALSKLQGAVEDGGEIAA
ncbi:P-loop containing nucleoside triphosphate hydrolase protein [Aaosphaeria arxii CBS 175.79]|uniref:ATP-dependent RNA helicase n=1 Tax=Aaosphaeria arxii CBS 175.79 TaxID=1450172 RepID=A0A6A5XEZ3_9PLEO|nr:P-loop containing nucleoside triphosphate hydrolase protein [Aaosphaeria arxii CBS 175.79]KAF2010964.1 P-loop containing nucleoside triphosphate hydrolase protein [Aaosphaeria arxii CBS 175.79]